MHRSVPVIACLLASPALADFATFSGEVSVTRPEFEAYYGGPVPLEDFESFAGGDQVGMLPALGGGFVPEDAPGNFLPLPTIVTNSSVTPPNWVANFNNERPAWSPWVIRPEEGELIYALGLTGAQGDWVRIEAFDGAGHLLGSVDSLPITVAFAGFVSTTPVARVIVTPLGNFDGKNGLDDLQISVVPAGSCYADVNGDGVLNILDFVAYQNLFQAGDPQADCDASGDLTILDFICFQQEFQVGCD